MRTIKTLILLAAMPAFGLQAQRPISIYEDSVTYASHKHPGVIAVIPEVTYESLQKAWVKEMESRTKSKAVYENGEWSIFGANVKSISPTPVNIYSNLVNQDSLVMLMVTMELKKDVYIEKGSAETELAQLKSYMKQFAKDQYSGVADDQLKAEEKKLRDLEKELSSYQKDESDLGKSIRDDEKTIKEEEDNLTVLNNELPNLSAEIITQNTQLAELTEGAAREEKEKYIRELEKRKKKLMNDIKSAENKISKANAGIRDANSDIPRKQSLQRELKEKVNTQEAIVRKFEYKLNTIKAY